MGYLQGLRRGYLSHALAPSSFRAYKSAFCSYQRFCAQLLLPPLPLIEDTLELYVSAMSCRLTADSIRAYLAGIQYFSRVLGSPVDMKSMHRLALVLRGVRRVQGKSGVRLLRAPIELPHLHLLLPHFQSHFSRWDYCMLRAVVCVAFFWSPALF